MWQDAVGGASPHKVLRNMKSQTHTTKLQKYSGELKHLKSSGVGNIRPDALQKLTTYLAKNHGSVVIEDLNLRGILKNHKARPINCRPRFL